MEEEGVVSAPPAAESEPLLEQNANTAATVLNHSGESSSSKNSSRRNSQKNNSEQDRALEVITMEPGHRCPSFNKLNKAFEKEDRWNHSGHDHGQDTLEKLTKREKLNQVSETFCVRLMSCCAGCIEG